MPQIPQFTASGRVASGRVADGQSIATAVQPSIALGNVGEAFLRAGRAVSGLADLNEQRNREKDLQWASEASSNLTRILNERRAADVSAPRETAGEDFIGYADEQLKMVSDAAPSAQAREMLMRTAREDINRGHAHALQIGEHSRLENAEVSNRRTVSNIAESYRQALTYDTPEGAAMDIAPMVSGLYANIDARFGATAPKFADAMRAYVAEEIVFATAATNPEYARQMVATAPVNEELRAMLNARIDATESSANAVERAAFETQWRLKVDAAQATGAMVQDIGESEFKARYGKNWQIKHNEFQTVKTIQNTAVTEARRISGMNPTVAAAEISNLSRTGTPQQQVATPALRRMNDESARLAEADPSQWQHRFDTDVQGLLATVSTLPPEAQPRMMESVYQLMEDRQGFPAPGDPHPERFLGRATTHILTADQADDRKRKLNAAALDDKLRMLAEMDVEFGSRERASQAYADMLELGTEKMSVALRFTSIISDDNTRREFAKAQIDAKALPVLDEESKKDYSDALDDSPEWRRFQSAWMGESGERRTQDVSDARTAISTYAQFLTVSGKAKDAKKAVDLAVERVVSENYAFAEVNGRPMAIAKARQSGPPRTDADAKDIGRRLGVLIATLPVQEVQVVDPITGASYFPGLPPTFDVDKSDDAKLLRDFITSRGFWQMMPDGESAMLTVADPSRMGLKVLNKQNEPIIVRFDDLPSFALLKPRLNQDFSVSQIVTGETPEQARHRQPMSTLPNYLRRGGRRFQLED